MNLSQLEFGALLAYSPRGTTPNAIHSKGVMQALKRDQYVGNPPTILMSEWVAKKVQQKMAELPRHLPFFLQSKRSSHPQTRRLLDDYYQSISLFKKPEEK